MPIFLRIILGVISWTTYEVLSGVLMLAGLILIPVAIAYRQWVTSPLPMFDEYGRPATQPRLITTAPSWLWLYGNDEDGFCPEWYRVLHPAWHPWRLMFMWAAIRNPVNNLRFIKALHPPQRAAEVRWATWGSFTLVWQGLLSRLIYDGSDYWFAIGWKYYPVKEDASGWQAYGQGFGLRWKRNS